MCGIIAIFYPEGRRNRPTDRSLVDRMCDLMSHRGPDHYGFYEDGQVTLGHRRLSIIDLSRDADQPMAKNGSVLVYNGEIYNFLEIRNRLEKEEGRRFSTRSDTEVILEAYDAWGPDCLREFNGMFALVLWDSKRKRLFVARDRLGVKPLYWTQVNGVTYFASDIKPLWEVVSPADLHLPAVTDYFLRSYSSTLETATRGISKFPPAHYGLVDQAGFQSHRYWDLNQVPVDRSIGFNEAVERTKGLLQDAVKIRLRSDVPVGTFLSGGVDSSLVTALASEGLEDFHTYSIGFDHRPDDESPYANQVALRYGTRHHHRVLTSACLEDLPKIVWYHSELFGDSSAVPSFYVSEMAKERLTVVLTGDGGDEGFGGYIDPFALYLLQTYRRLPRSVREGLSRLALPGRLGRFNRLSLLGLEEIYADLRDGGWSPLRAAFLRDGSIDWGIPLRACKRGGDVDRLLYADIQDRLTEDFLVKVDRATMAHSLEARSPYLDYRLIEFGFSLDHPVRYHRLQRKAVLKKIAERYLAHDLIYRRKVGFSIPKAQWLRFLLPKILPIVRRRSLLDELFDRKVIETVLGEFGAGNDSHANRIWLLLWFQLWEGLFVSKVYQPDQRLSNL